MNKDEVQLILDPDEYVYMAGDLTTLTAKERRELGDLMLKGYTMKSVPHEEYKKMDLKWLFEKPKPSPITPAEADKNV